MPFCAIQDDKAVNSLDMIRTDNYAHVHVTNHPTNPLAEGGELLLGVTQFPEIITMNMYCITLQSRALSAFPGAAFAGLYGGRPAYTSKTPPTSR